MTQRDVTITNQYGLHSRPATFFTQKACMYKSNIRVRKGDWDANAKSLLSVLSMGIANEMTVTLIADGDDELAALDGLEYLLSGMEEIVNSNYSAEMLVKYNLQKSF